MDPHEPGRISVTLKSDGKDGTWIVFHGNAAEIRSQIVHAFDLQEEADAPLYDLINEATRIYKAASNTSSALGGRVLSRNAESTPAGGGSAWDRVGNGAPAEPEVDPNIARLLGEIEAATTVDALRELYARNAAHFTDADLMSAWQAKGKSLS